MSTVAIGSIAAAGIGAAGSALGASAQAGAAESAAQLQAQEAQNALDFQKQEWQTQQQNEAPFLRAGTAAENTLASLTSTPGEGLLTPWTGTFKAPTAAEAEATPGFQFEMGQGVQALENSAAANGGLLTTGNAKQLTNYAENVASTNYQQTYQNALTAYETAYNTFQNNQTNTFDRLATQAGVGQTTATQLGQQGNAAAGNVSNTLLTSGAQQGQQLNNAAAATASGYAGVANSLGAGVQGIGQALTLQQLLANNYGTNNPYAPVGSGPYGQGPTLEQLTANG